MADTHSLLVVDPTSISSLGGITQVRYSINDQELDAVGRCMTPPAVFCLDDNPAETLAFIDDFQKVRLLNLHLPRHSGMRPKIRRRTRWIGTYTDLAAIRTITPAAALVLAA